MNKKLIRLTEGDLHKIVKESVSKIINEIGDTPTRIGENRIINEMGYFEDIQMRFDSLLNTCEEETERLIKAIFKSNGIFKAGNDEVMVMRLRELLNLLKTHASQKFERVKNSIAVDSLLDILNYYHKTVKDAYYNLESLDYQGLNSYVQQLEHLLIGVL